MFFHSRSRSREFLGMIASDSHSQIVGMDFFHSLPVPEFWECFFPVPFLFPNFGNGIIHSCSRTPKSHSRSPLPQTENRLSATRLAQTVWGGALKESKSVCATEVNEAWEAKTAGQPARLSLYWVLPCLRRSRWPRMCNAEKRGRPLLFSRQFVLLYCFSPKISRPQSTNYQIMSCFVFIRVTQNGNKSKFPELCRGVMAIQGVNRLGSLGNISG